MRPDVVVRDLNHFCFTMQQTLHAHLVRVAHYMSVLCRFVTLSLRHSVTSSLCHSGKECWITALHVSRRNVCVGLTNGKILILQSVGGAMLPLTTFSCHQQQVKCLTTLPPDHADGMGHHHGDEHSWQRAMPHPRPAHLVSCGLGFHSYPSPSPSEQPSIPHPNALPPAKILTWDLAGLQ